MLIINQAEEQSLYEYGLFVGFNYIFPPLQLDERVVQHSISSHASPFHRITHYQCHHRARSTKLLSLQTKKQKEMYLKFNERGPV